MVKFRFDEVQAVALVNWKDKDGAPVVFFIGRGALHWLVRDVDGDFRVGEEVNGVTEKHCKDGKIDERFFVLMVPPIIQGKTFSPSVQFMPDDELASILSELKAKRIANPQYEPYDREFEVCNNEKLRRLGLHKNKKRSKPSEGDAVPGDGSDPIVAG